MASSPRSKRKRHLNPAAVGVGMIGVVALVLLVLAFHKTSVSATPGKAAPLPSIAAGPPLAVWLGDSFTEGTGAKSQGTSFAAQVSARMGWQYNDFAQGATGYVANGAVAQFPERRPIPDHVAETVALQPAVVIVAGGLNDNDQDPAKVAASAHRTYTGLRAGLPTARIVVVGPFWPDGDPIPGVLAVRDALRREAKATGLPFIDPIAEKWITGRRGLNGAPGTGAAAVLTGPDGTHPTQAGHDNIARRLLSDMRSLPLPTAAPDAH